MSIDDKNIGGEGYTIIANKETKKIAAMIMSTKHQILESVLHKVPRKIRWNVQSLSRDLAESYNWVGRTCFPNAVQIADKFHMVKLGLEALQDVRVRYRQKALSQEWQDEKKFPQNFSNGDTLRQLLARSRYLLFSFESEWTESQRERAQILFQYFPEIENAYRDILAFRRFYRTEIGSPEKASRSLSAWFKRMKKSEVPELKTFVKTVKDNEETILAYFMQGRTNAFAESLNAKIQRFLISNYGIRDRNFFHFRLSTFLA